MLNVLIADDELLMRIGLKSMIDWEAQGFHIAGEAANGKEALDMAQIEPPDVIITDIIMPVMDGLELIQEASRLLDSCQYIILSCMDEFKYVKEALKLGAADYLIKSQIKPQQLVEVLASVKEKIEKTARKENPELTASYKQSVNYLKETLFKELFSGFRNEEDVIKQIPKLNIKVKPEDMIVIKLKVDQFETIRKKYVEKDEKLLRYAIVNILEELIPRKWSKEIVIENSAEYLIVMNVPTPSGDKGLEAELNRMFEKLLVAMKDFLNITLSIGVSSPVPTFRFLKAAYQEADIALSNHFADDSRKVIYFADAVADSAKNRQDFVMGKDEEKAYKLALESHDYEKFNHRLETLKDQLKDRSITEQSIRTTYIRLMEWINSHFTTIPEFQAEGTTPYERLLEQETLTGMHQLVLNYLDQSIRNSRTMNDLPPSYADMAIRMMMNHYAEDDLSLQSVANRINVNSSYLSRIFKQETGENFINFLTKIRIDKAKFYLEQGNLKIYEVAEKVGYPNTTYFSTIFKKWVGVTPEKYRG